MCTILPILAYCVTVTAVEKVDVISTLEQLTATEAVRALSLTGLTNRIQLGQYTIFAPTNEAFEKFNLKVS